jgi:hypothetical protein
MDSTSSQIITCTVPSPSITLVEIPIKVTELNSHKLLSASLNEPLTLEYEIKN